MHATGDEQPRIGSDAANLAAHCDQSCRAYADRFAFGLKLGGTWWWVPRVELLPMIEGFRGGLAVLGVSAGDSVAIASSNRLEWAVACYAAWGRGATVVPADADLSEAAWRHVLRDSRARVAIGDSAAMATLRRVQAETPTLLHRIGIGDGGGEAALAFRGVVEMGQRRPAALTASDGTRRALWLYGRDGAETPPRVERTHREVAAAAETLRRQLGLGTEDRVLPVAAWGHHAAALHACIAAGATVLVDDGASSLAAILIEAQPTVICAEGWTLQHWDAQFGAAGFLRARCVAAASRRGAGQALGWLDARLLALADRLVPPSRLGPFGGELRTGDSRNDTAADATPSGLARATGVRVHALA